MLPQLAAGGCTPTPKKLSADSSRMLRAIASVHGDDERPGRVEQQVPREQPRKPRPGGPGGDHELARAQREDLGAGDARGFHPPDGADEHDEERHRWRKHRAEDHQEQQPRHRQHRVGEAHQHAVSPPAGVAGHAADRDADAARHQSRQQADGERDARAMQHARQQSRPSSSVPNQCVADGAARRLARSRSFG